MDVTVKQGIGNGTFLICTESYHGKVAILEKYQKSLITLVEGKSNNTSTVILNSSGTETTVFNERVGLNSVILFVPRSSNAAGETDHIFIKTKFKGSFIIGHRNHGHSDVELDYIVVG
jgi:hypothetical protein